MTPTPFEPVVPEEPEVACSLDPVDLPGRLDQWRMLAAAAVSRDSVDGGVRLALGPDTSLSAVAQLVEAEQACCPFFAFTITIDHLGVALEVRAPAGAEAAVASLLNS